MNILKRFIPTTEAHCDAPCGVYDPSSARVAAEAVLSMTKKILELKTPELEEEKALLAYHHTLMRYTLIKEAEAQKTKDQLLILWTDYFKPQHLQAIPDLHDIFWQAAKLCSACKVEVSLEHAEELLRTVEKIHKLFWETKGKKVEWVRAG